MKFEKVHKFVLYLYVSQHMFLVGLCLLSEIITCRRDAKY